MLSINLSVCVLDETDYVVPQGPEPDIAPLLPINAQAVSYWEAELLQERLQEFLKQASDGDADDAAKAQVWWRFKAATCTCCVWGQ